MKKVLKIVAVLSLAFGFVAGGSAVFANNDEAGTQMAGPGGGGGGGGDYPRT